MRSTFTGLTVLLVCVASGRAQEPEGPSVAPGPPRVVVVPVVGPIELRNQALVLRAVERARELRPELVLFEIDTPGGRVDHMLAMGEAMMSLDPIPTAAFVRPLGSEGFTGGAMSAGAYLALSCKRMYMAPGTVIGAAMPVLMGGEGMEAAGEKIVSALREKFRARAEQNGYPANLAVAMVDKDLEVFEVKVGGAPRYVTSAELDALREAGEEVEGGAEPFIAEDKLLTLTAPQVEAAGMGKVVERREEVFSDLGLAAPEVEEIRPTWSEDLVGFLTSGVMSLILLVVGVLGIWVELKSPGFGAAGVVGIVAIGLLLFGHHLAGLAEIPEILLVVVGIVLVAVEIFVFPGMGVFAVAGAACVLAGLVLSFQGFVLPDVDDAPWQMEILFDSLFRVVLGFVAATAAFVAVMRFLPKVPMANRLVLQASVGGVSPSAPGATGELVGRHGHAVTPLNPGGKVEVDGEVYDVTAEGDYVARGEPVEILRLEGPTVVVGKLKR